MNGYGDYGGYGGTGMSPTRTTDTMSMPRYELDPQIHKWMFNNEEILKEVERNLRGVVYDREKHKWIQVLIPLLNDDGINMIIYILKPYTSHLFAFSNFREDDIKVIMMQFMEDLIPILGVECDRFGIDESHLSIIKRIVEDTVYATLRKAKDGLSLGFLRDTQKTVETVGKGGGGGFSIFKMFQPKQRQF